MTSTILKHLKVGSPAWIHDYDADGQPVYPDYYNILHLLLESLNFTYTFVKPRYESFGYRLYGDNWTGMIGMMLRGEIDTAISPFELLDNSPIDCSFPIFYDRLTFLTQNPRPTQKNPILFQPFYGTVWMVFVFCTVTFLSLFYAMNERDKRKYVRTFFCMLGSSLGQPFSIRLTTRNHSILFSAWILAIAILIHSYNAIILSFLLAVPTKGISTIDELTSAITAGSVKCRTYKEDKAVNVLIEANIESYTIIGKELYENSKDVDIPDMYMDPKSDQRTCFIAPESHLQQKKNMSVSKDSFYIALYGFPLPKNFRRKEVIDKKLERMLETGLIEKFKNDFIIKYALVLQRRQISNSIYHDTDIIRKRITLEDFRGAFIVLGSGLTLALLTLIGEIVIFKMSRR